LEYEEVIRKLKSLHNLKNIEGMARFGINSTNTLGVPMPILRDMAKKIGKKHGLALKLWSSGIHEARILAALVDEPSEVTEEQMDSWTGDFDSWDVCDQVCMNLFYKTPFAQKKVFEYSFRKEEFVKRTSFALIASLAFHHKSMSDDDFRKFFPLIKKASTDDRNFVRKSVNWGLRQIGKRNLALNKDAIKVAEEIQKVDSKAARWIANDAIRELKGESVKKRLKK
jgi:3-methyladenine DNA glycosylase AlkD